MKVLDVLTNEKKWLKNGWSDGYDKFCVMGAINKTDQSYDDAANALHEAILVLYPERMAQWKDGCSRCCVYFNNHPDTTFEDIQRVVKFADV